MVKKIKGTLLTNQDGRPVAWFAQPFELEAEEFAEFILEQIGDDMGQVELYLEYQELTITPRSHRSNPDQNGNRTS